MKAFLVLLLGSSLSASLVLTGCASKAPESEIAAVAGMAPDSWAASKGARVGIDTHWVARVGGSEGEKLVREALAQNPDMRVAAERVKRAEQVAKTEAGGANPQISAGIDAERSKRIFVGFPFGDGGIPSSISSTHGANLNVSWEPDVWGFNRAGVEALIAQAQGENQAYRAARASLAGQVLKAWLALGEANEQIALAQKAVESRKSTSEVIRDRFEAALGDSGGSAGDLRLSETQLESARAMLIQRQGEKEQALRQVEILLGRYPSGSFVKNGGLPKALSAPPAGLPSDLLLRRPDILQAERQVASAGRLMKQGKLAFFPSFPLTASGGTTTDALRDILKSDFGVWSLAGSLSQPIWAGGRLWSEYERLKSDERSALANLQSTVLKAFGEVEQGLVAERFLAARIAAVEKALKSAEGAENQAYDDYAGGTGEVLTILSAQNSRIELASQLVTLRRLRLDSRVDFHLALGGDFKVTK